MTTPASIILGIDTGGTFTDFVLWREGQLRIHKVLSTPAAPEQAILQGLRELGLAPAALGEQLVTIHGSTVATNAALEGKGVRTALITNRGLKDLLTIGRQARGRLYDLQPTPLPPPVPAELCLETGGRLDPCGHVVEDLSDADLALLNRQITELAPTAVAINLLYSYVDDRFERRIEAAMPAGMFVARSSFVLPEYKEYERGIATWLNAWLGPLISGYLQRLQTHLDPSPLSIMQSSGGTIAAEQAARRAVNLLLSGPAGGLAGALYLGRLAGSSRLISFDMGGTSTDVALLCGDIRLTNEGRIGPYPVAVPMVDMATIGAGGGSIAYLDDGGMLHVGPESAGAQPGPACYGRGGSAPTVTDANLALGRLRADQFLGGSMALDEAAARHALQRLADGMGKSLQDAAEGIIRLANEHMGRALREISVQRGFDPREFTLCCFGGAGGLHVCDLAENLGIRHAIVPLHGGVLSALGMLVAPRERQASRTLRTPLAATSADQLTEALAGLARSGRAELQAEGVDDAQIAQEDSLDLRYRGQSYTLNTPWRGRLDGAEADFHELHALRYGHRMHLPVELVNVRCRVYAPGSEIELPTANVIPERPVPATIAGLSEAAAVFDRDMLAIGRRYAGPLLITERVSTTLIKSGWQVRRDALGNLLLEYCHASQAGQGQSSETAAT